MRRKRSSEASSRCARGSTRILPETRTAGTDFQPRRCVALASGRRRSARAEGTRVAIDSLLTRERRRPAGRFWRPRARRTLGRPRSLGCFTKIGDPGSTKIVKPTPRETAGENPGDESRAPIRRPQPIGGRRGQNLTIISNECSANPAREASRWVSRTTVTPHRTIARASLDSSAPWRLVRRWVSRPARCVRRWRRRRASRPPWSPAPSGSRPVPWAVRLARPLRPPVLFTARIPRSGVAAPRARRVGRVPSRTSRPLSRAKTTEDARILRASRLSLGRAGRHQA